MTRSYKRTITMLFILFSGIILKTQAQYNCGTTQMNDAAKLAHPELVQQEQDYNAWITQHIAEKKSERSVETVYTIPMVFHILHTLGSENISDAQIQDEVAILNRDYAKLNADTINIVGNSSFDTLAANIKIQFRLATIDPNGNCTNGIDRIYTHKTNQADEDSKLNQWPRQKYLNVWVVKTIGSAGVAGYAFYPSAVDHFLASKDGIIILSNYIGSIGTGAAFSSRALTHEIGHWLNLEHVWGNNNDPEISCGDDQVQDTPFTKGHLSCDAKPYCTVSPVYTHSYNFQYVNPSTSNIDPTPVINNQNLYSGSFISTGVSANPTDASRFAFSGWGTGAVDADTAYASLTGAINASQYYEVTFIPNYGNNFSVTGFTFTANRTATGPRTFAVRSSLNNFASNIPGTIAPASPNLTKRGPDEFYFTQDTAISVSGIKLTIGANYKNINHQLTFRIYGWNAEDAAGSLGIDNVVLTDTAGLIENYQNYMDYSYCSVMFTKGQKDRMRAALESPVAQRNHLWSSDNLDSTGTNGISNMACVPHPGFYANRQVICPGKTITFFQNLSNAAATSRVWTFNGGTPSTSTAVSPTITYNTPGKYAVKLKTTNAMGSDSVTVNYFVFVNESYPTYSGISGEDFEQASSYWDMVINNYDNNANYWSVVGNAGYSGNHSIRMKAYNNYPYDVDDFITKPFNVSFVSNPKLTFRISGASRGLSSLDATENLKIYSSIDCGQTWQQRANLNHIALFNKGYAGSLSYLPASQNDWALTTVNLPPGIGSNNIYFKFEYTSSAVSNNIYIDDIYISGTTGITESNFDNSSFSVSPNPANESTVIYYHLNAASEISIQLTDIIGKTVMKTTVQKQGEGDHNFVINKEDYHLKAGIYIIKFAIDNTAMSRKLVMTD